MNLSSLLAKMFYWNCWFSNKKKMVSIRALKNKLFNPKYMVVYLYKQDEPLKYLLPNMITLDYHDFIAFKKMLNKQQHIILLNNVHDIPTIYNELLDNGFKVSVLDWKKYKNINNIIQDILKK